ncbi:MAG: GNAT family N-acetyltransferase [Planctomycetes bacterium]|nr:GNAT family N-acetyltransferase [Planctomycetota bacterium]
MSFVGPEHTSFDWQKHESTVAVWSIGAMEQHGHHLPLLTDTMQGDFFARMLAEDMGYALLPTLPYGTSMEHKGFRGSITLTPEILMSFVYQMADELEGQNFNRMIIVNAHGGNFSLFPAVRHVNRQDRNIKIIVMNPWELRGDAVKCSPEIHAGEMETSIMLGIGQPVGDDRRDSDPFAVGFKQSDLNMYGVGRLNPDGVWGAPSKASKAKGKKIIAQVRKQMKVFVQRHLELLDADARYGGAGPVAIRPMVEEDLIFGLEMSRLASWNQKSADWQMYFAASKGKSFVALRNGAKAGTVTTINYQKKFSWIGMVLVDPEIRRSGIGKKLLQESIDAAKADGIVRLDATPAGKKLYDRLGFKDECHLSRMQCTDLPTLEKSAIKVQKMKKSDLAAVIVYDAKQFGAKREAVLRALFANASEYAFVLKSGKSILGFCLGRHGHDFEQVGPVVANDAATAEALLVTALAKCGDKAVIVDSMDEQKPFNALLLKLNFTEQRKFIRMYLGKKPTMGTRKTQFAISGPELG